jgi:hypothetical protein
LGNNTIVAFTRGVQFSFFTYSYSLIAKPLYWDEYDCSIAALLDICAMKLSAITKRGSRKDFIDICVLGLETGWRLDTMLSFYREKYKVSEIVSVLYGLSYFADAEIQPTPEMHRRLSWKKIKQTIQSWVRDFC